MTSKILKIALVGRTNAGKSTLINRIVGEKISIQNKKINTTQVTIIGVKNIKKTQLIFLFWIEIFSPTILLINVDLPALVLPTRAIFKILLTI